MLFQRRRLRARGRRLWGDESARVLEDATTTAALLAAAAQERTKLEPVAVAVGRAASNLERLASQAPSADAGEAAAAVAAGLRAELVTVESEARGRDADLAVERAPTRGPDELHAGLDRLRGQVEAAGDRR